MTSKEKNIDDEKFNYRFIDVYISNHRQRFVNFIVPTIIEVSMYWNWKVYVSFFTKLSILQYNRDKKKKIFGF